LWSFISYIFQFSHDRRFVGVIEINPNALQANQPKLITRMYSLNDITNGCVKVEIPVETPCNRASSQMLFPSEIHALKKEAAETPCSAVRQETISLPREAGYAVRSIEETSGQSDLLNIQITNVQGAPYNQNSSNDEVTANHIEDHANELSIRGGNNQEMQSNFDCGAHEKMAMGNSQLFKHVDTQENVYPVDTDVRSPINESSFYNGIPLAATAEQERETSRQLNSHEGVTSSHLSHHPYTESPQTPFSSFQMSNQYPLPGKYQTDGAMAGYQLDAQSVSSYQGDATVVIPSFMSSKGTVPLYHLAVQEEMTAPQVGDDARYQVKNYQPEMSSYHVGHYPHESPTVRQFHQKQNYDEGPNRRRSTGSTCHCCCHSPSEGDSYFSPAFGLENQRPSVIMVPVSWSSTTSGTSHVPLKVRGRLYFNFVFVFRLLVFFFCFVCFVFLYRYTFSSS